MWVGARAAGRAPLLTADFTRGFSRIVKDLYFSQSGRGRKRQKLSIGGESAIGNNCVAVGVEISSEGAVRLKRNDTTGADILALEQGLEGFQYRSIGGLREQSQQRALALKQAAQDAGDRKGPVTVGYGGENIHDKLFGEQNGAFGLAAGAEISGATGKCQEMLLAAFCTANSGETALKPPTGQELLNRTHNHRT